MEDTRETCCKNDCDRPAVVVLKVYVKDSPPVFLPFCMNHLLDASQVVELLMTGIMDVDKED